MCCFVVIAMILDDQTTIGNQKDSIISLYIILFFTSTNPYPHKKHKTIHTAFIAFTKNLSRRKSSIPHMQRLLFTNYYWKYSICSPVCTAASERYILTTWPGGWWAWPGRRWPGPWGHLPGSGPESRQARLILRWERVGNKKISVRGIDYGFQAQAMQK